MKYVWITAACAICAALGCHKAGVRTTHFTGEPSVVAAKPAPPQDTRFWAELQSGEKSVLCTPEQDWLALAQAVADTKQEAVAVTQNGKLVALINPSK